MKIFDLTHIVDLQDLENPPKKNKKMAKTMKIVKISKKKDHFHQSKFQSWINESGLSFTLRPPQKDISTPF